MLIQLNKTQDPVVKQFRKPHRKWLDKANQDQIAFTRKYLKDKNWLTNESDEIDQLYEQLIETLDFAQSQKDGVLIDDLRRKWREEKIKLTHDVVNIRISKLASKQLKLLSRQKPKNKVFEDMILKEGRSLANYNRQVSEIRHELNKEFQKRNRDLLLKYSRLKSKFDFELDKDAVSVKNRDLEEKLGITQLHLYRTLEELARRQIVMADNHLDTLLLTDTQSEKFKAHFEQLKEKYLPDDWRNIEGKIEGFVPLKDYPCQELENSAHTSTSEQTSTGINTDEETGS